MPKTFYAVSVLSVAVSLSGSVAFAADTEFRAPTQAKVAELAKSVRTVSDLNPLAKTACSVEPWQVVFTLETKNEVRVDRSPTMDSLKVRCVFALLAQTKFRIANSANQR